jgi:hypothetical protein
MCNVVLTAKSDEDFVSEETSSKLLDVGKVIIDYAMRDIN